MWDVDTIYKSATACCIEQGLDGLICDNCASEYATGQPQALDDLVYENKCTQKKARFISPWWVTR
jgi:hypothetical protein